MDVNVTIRIDRIDDLIKAAGMLAGLHSCRLDQVVDPVNPDCYVYIHLALPPFFRYNEHVNCVERPRLAGL